MNESRQFPVLDVQDLTVAYHQAGRWLEVVHQVSLQVNTGEVYGLVGESGSGKTTLALAVLRYLGENSALWGGKIRLNGHDVTAATREEMRTIWGRQVALVPQNPGSSLNPSLRIGEQISEGLRFVQGLGVREAEDRALELMEVVHIPDPKRVAHSFPHQISGGMAQRVLIATALSSEPALLILDEPTTDLDVTTQATILDLLKELIHASQTAVLYITHNLGVVAQLCNRVGVLYAGELVEEARSDALFSQPVHPYTQGLLASVPQLSNLKGERRLQAIGGAIPAGGMRPAGCVFQPRCPLAIDSCAAPPELVTIAEARRVRCHRWGETLAGAIRFDSFLESSSGRDKFPAESGPEVLSLDQVEIHFPVNRSLPAILRGEAQLAVRAVDGISFRISRGETVGLVGESGSGKTTLARAIVGLVERTRGSMEFLGILLPPSLSDRDKRVLRQMQLVFQNPEGALNPYMTVAEILSRPLVSLLGLTGSAARRKVLELLNAVRLPEGLMERPASQLSGGEKQRVAIARALASNPSLLVCDEPVSSLDVSVQAAIINLLRDLQHQLGSSLLFISHDLAVVSELADIIAVVYLGHLVEVSKADDLLIPPHHPYTEALLSAIPGAHTEIGRKNIRLVGEIPSPVNKPAGCPFHTRCQHTLGEVCEQLLPSWQLHKATGKRYWCHIPLEELSAVQKSPLYEGGPVEE